MLRNPSFLLAIALCTTLFAARNANAGAKASADQARVAVQSFRGPHAQRLQGAVETGLMGRYYLVPDFSVTQMARKQGVAMKDPDGLAQVGRALQVRAFLSAEVQKKRNWHVAVVVRSGDTGAAIGRFVVADRSLDHLENTLATRTSRRVGFMLARASSNDATASADLSPPTVSDSVSAEAMADEERPGEVVELDLQTRVFNRAFVHTQNLSGVPDYLLGGAMAANLSAHFHPLALLSQELAPLGIAAGLEYGLGVSSRVAGSETRATTDVHGYNVAFEYRVRLGDSSLTPTLGYARSVFNASANPGAPNVDYGQVTPGLTGRWAATDRLSFDVGALYLHVISAGALANADRFPRVTARGVEASLSVAYNIVSDISVEAGAGLRRFGIATNVKPGDPVIAGGAIDQTTWVGLGLSYRPAYRRANP